MSPPPLLLVMLMALLPPLLLLLLSGFYQQNYKAPLSHARSAVLWANARATQINSRLLPFATVLYHAVLRLLEAFVTS